MYPAPTLRGLAALEKTVCRFQEFFLPPPPLHQGRLGIGDHTRGEGHDSTALRPSSSAREKCVLHAVLLEMGWPP